MSELSKIDLLLAALNADVDRLVEEPRGSNWGAAVKTALNFVGIDFPAPWCSAYVCEKLSDAGIEGPKTGWCPSLEAWFRERGHLRTSAVIPQPGWVFFIYYKGIARVGHVGFVWSFDYHSDVVTTVEGNTNLDGSREGYGVFRKKRDRHSIYSFGVTT